MTTSNAPGPIEFNETVREAINGALAHGTPLVVAYVDTDGQPKLSFRGSAQVYGDNQLAVWVRNPEGGLQRALAANPRLTLLYRSTEPRMMINIQGRGHLDSSDEARKTVYETSPQSEQNADKDRKGLALIIDVDRVNGVVPGAALNMQRQ